MMVNDYLIHLEFDSSDAALEDEDPSHYLYVTSGKVIAHDALDRKLLAGKFHVCYVDVCAALNANASVYDVFDTYSTTVDYYEAIFDLDTLDISDKLSKLFKYQHSFGNVLILDRLEILPRFRSHNLGLIVMRRLIERFGAGAEVVAIKPFPLQCEAASSDDARNKWRQRLQLSKFDKNHRRATAKLRRHYQKLGFRALKGTPFMFRLGDLPLPGPEELMK